MGRRKAATQVKASELRVGDVLDTAAEGDSEIIGLAQTHGGIEALVVSRAKRRRVLWFFPNQICTLAPRRRDRARPATPLAAPA